MVLDINIKAFGIDYYFNLKLFNMHIRQRQEILSVTN